MKIAMNSCSFVVGLIFFKSLLPFYIFFVCTKYNLQMCAELCVSAKWADFPITIMGE